MDTLEGNAATRPVVGIVGDGLVGSRVAINLSASGVEVRTIAPRDIRDAFQCNVAVLAQGGKHAGLLSTLAAEGVGAVSVGDDLEDVMASLDLHDRAVARGTAVVVGAASSPGMSGLLLAHVARAFDVVDEVHVASHGTGGPACAHQHHESLSGTAIGWHDGEWLQRPAGSGRELCWFPDPVGARDCYRYASPEPLLLQRISPSLKRITARVSATRRDRLTARLPMLTPPHAEGGVGGLRLEVRGTRNGARRVEIVGVAERTALVAGAVAARTALALAHGTVPAGVHNLGQAAVPNAEILDGVVAAGITLHEFVGA